MSNNSQAPWPELPTAAWRDTCATLQLWTQIVGKIRLTKSPWLNHSWHVTLYVTPRGLTTSPVPDGARTFQIDFDFIDHRCASRPATARSGICAADHSVASFYAATLAALAELGIAVAIDEMPNELPDPISFSEDTAHASYDPDAVGASCKSSSIATASSSNSAPASSARQARCISSGAVSISR
jgi:hypothetical protein